MSSTVFYETTNMPDFKVATAFNTLIIAIVSIGFVWYLQFRWGRRHLYRLAAKVPHVNCTSWPLIGIGHQLIGNLNGYLEPLMKISSLKTTTKFWIGPHLFFVLYKPEDIEIVLNSRTCLEKHFIYKFIKTFGGEGLFSAIVKIWKSHRRLIQPTFNQTILNSFVDIFATQSQVFVKMLKTEEGAEIDIDHRLANWGIDSICESAIGVKINAQTSNNILAKSISRMWTIAMNRILIIFYHSDIIFKKTGLYEEAMKIKKSLNDHIDNIIKIKHTEIKENISENLNSIDTDKRKFKTFLDLLMELKYEKGRLTEQELQDEILTIFIAGSDTSKQTMGFILQMLGMFPDIQKKIFEEIIDVIDTNRKVECTDLPKLVYTERVIKETMRLFPIAPFFGRKLGADLDISDYTLPKGAGAVISPIMVHRSPLYWKDPLTFDPDRFLPEEVAKRHPYTYIPFSAGPRNCIGHKYAMMSMKTFIATVVKEYVFKSPYTCIEELKCDADLILKPVNGFPISFVTRR